MVSPFFFLVLLFAASFSVLQEGLNHALRLFWVFVPHQILLHVLTTWEVWVVNGPGPPQPAALTGGIQFTATSRNLLSSYHRIQDALIRSRSHEADFLCRCHHQQIGARSWRTVWWSLPRFFRAVLRRDLWLCHPFAGPFLLWGVLGSHPDQQRTLFSQSSLELGRSSNIAWSSSLLFLAWSFTSVAFSMFLHLGVFLTQFFGVFT